MADRLASLLTRIADEESALPADDLHQLSDLFASSAAAFERAWPTLSAHRRRDILHRLAEISRYNFEVDFLPIALMGVRDQDSGVRLTALDMFWDAEAPELIAPLLRLLHHDPEMTVQAGAAQVLGRFVLAGELGQLSHQVLDHLTSDLLGIINDLDRPVLVRCRALEALAAASLSEVPALVQDAYRSQEDVLRIGAVAAMGRTADPCWESIVLAELDSNNPSMRFHAARAAGMLALNELVPPLVELLDDPDSEVMIACIWALGEIGGDEARSALERLLDDGDIGDLARDALEMTELLGGLPLPLPRSMES